jgi:hypothetical protein
MSVAGASGAALALALVSMGGAAPLAPGALALRLEPALAVATRVFAGADGARVTVAELSGDRTGNAGWARGALALGVAWAPRSGLRLEARLPLVLATSWREARDSLSGAHVATEHRSSFGLGDAEVAALAALWRGVLPGGPASIDGGLWLSAPTGRPRALVPTDDGLVETGPVVRAFLPLGNVALGAEVLWRIRPVGRPHRVLAHATVGLAPPGARCAVALGARADLAVGRGRADNPVSALESADGFAPDPAPIFASTAPARARLDATAGAVLRAGPLVVGAELAVALWGRTDAAGATLSLFAELGTPAPARAGAPPP